MPPKPTARLLNQHGFTPSATPSTSTDCPHRKGKTRSSPKRYCRIPPSGHSPHADTDTQRSGCHCYRHYCGVGRTGWSAQLTMFYKTRLLLPSDVPLCSQSIWLVNRKAGGQTPQVSFHPLRDFEIQSEAEAVAVDLDTSKTNPSALKKYVRPGSSPLVYYIWDRLSTGTATVV